MKSSAKINGFYSLKCLDILMTDILLFVNPINSISYITLRLLIKVTDLYNEKIF